MGGTRGRMPGSEDPDPGRNHEDANAPRDGPGTDWPPHFGLWLLLLPVRLAAMAACGCVLFVALALIDAEILPRTNTLTESFDRLGREVVIGGVAGVALGALLTHPLGRRKLHPEARMWQALVAALLLLGLTGLFMLSR